MKAIIMMNGHTLSQDQFKVCSAMATMVSNIKNATNSSEYKGHEIRHYQSQLHGLKWAAVLIGIPESVIYDITLKNNIRGYQNLNKMTETIYF